MILPPAYTLNPAEQDGYERLLAADVDVAEAFRNAASARHLFEVMLQCLRVPVPDIHIVLSTPTMENELGDPINVHLPMVENGPIYHMALGMLFIAMPKEQQNFGIISSSEEGMQAVRNGEFGHLLPS